MSPALALTQAEVFLPRQGRALDLAGGVGRNALWLAERGLDVTLADISENALVQAADHAAERGLSIDTLAIDLEEDAFPEGPWSVVVDTFYFQRDLFAAICGQLAPGGVLVFCQPTVENLARNPRPSRRFLIEPGLAPTLVADLEVVHHWEGWTAAGSHEVHLVARRPLI
jgi:2-polyprenyl-3-methyl-5-hydroxy-6-metoxy-1,4-benzoquinol methylase